MADSDGHSVASGDGAPMQPSENPREWTDRIHYANPNA